MSELLKLEGLELGNTFSVISIGFLVGYLILGLYAGRNTNTVEDHCVMGRSASAFFIVGTLIASNLSSVTFTGFTATSMIKGPLALISQFGASVTGSLILGLFVGKYFYRLKLLTLPEFFTRRYPGKAATLGASLIVVVSMTAYMITVMLGTTVVANNLFGWPTHITLLVVMIAITLFTVVGGMRSVVVTDTAMFVVFLVAALIIGPSVVWVLGGFENAITLAQQKAGYIFRWHGTEPGITGFMNVLEMNVLSFLLVLSAPHLLSRINIARSEREFGKAMIIVAVALPTLIIFLLYPFSFFALAETNVEPVAAYVWVCRNVVPVIVGSLGLAGVLSAAISTATSLFQQASATLSCNIVKDFFYPNMSDKTLLLVSRINVVVIAVIVYVGSLSPHIGAATIMYAFLFATAAFGAWFPALYLGVLWRRATTSGAVWSMFISLPLIIIVALGRQKGWIPLWIPTNVVGVVAATAIMVVVSLCTAEDEGNKIFDLVRKQDLDAVQLSAECDKVYNLASAKEDRS